MKHMLKNFFLQKTQICQYKKHNNNKHRISIDKSTKINKNLNKLDITQTEIENKIFNINKKMNSNPLTRNIKMEINYRIEIIK